MTSTGSSNSGVFPAPPGKKITLRSSDGSLFNVEESIAMEFVRVKTFFEAKVETIVPLPNVSAKYLPLIIEYCKEQQKLPGEAKKSYDEKFVAGLGIEELKEMILAVNFLDIKSLLDVLNQEVADRISRPKRRPRFANNMLGLTRMLRTRSF